MLKILLNQENNPLWTIFSTGKSLGKIVVHKSWFTALFYKQRKKWSMWMRIACVCRACKCGNVDMVDLLLRHHASTISCTSQEMTPIHIACHFENTDCVKLLLQVRSIIFNMQLVLQQKIQIKSSQLSQFNIYIATLIY